MSFVNIKTFNQVTRDLQAQIDALRLAIVPSISEVKPAQPAESQPAESHLIFVDHLKNSAGLISLDNLLDEKVVEKLNAGGYETIEQVAAASDEELLTVSGIGPARLTEIRQAIPYGG